jgi:hypothetical protein
MTSPAIAKSKTIQYVTDDEIQAYELKREAALKWLQYQPLAAATRLHLMTRMKRRAKRMAPVLKIGSPL